ncbi:MAG: ABC transporter ATP-binding protein [Planctomycetaceae bacterium]
MNTFTRVLPYVWPHRRKVYLSFVFAGFVALFWSVNLSVAFPIVKVLLQGQSLEDYVQAEIATAEKEITRRTATLHYLESRIKELQEADPNLQNEAAVELLKNQSRQQTKISEASRQLHIMNWVRAYVVPILPGDQFDMLAAILTILLVATVLKGLCIFVQDVLVGSVVELTAMGIRKQCFRKTLALDYQTLHMHGSSDLMSRFTHDLHLLAHGMRLLGGKVIREPLKAACCVFGAFLVCWQLTLLSMLFVPLVGWVFYRIGRKLKQASRRMMESMSRIYKTLDETLSGAKIVIAFNGARKHRQQFHRINKEYYSKARKIVGIDALTSPTTEVLGLLAAFVALLPGAYLVLRGTTEIWGITLTSRPMDIAELSLLYVLLAGVIDPVRKLSTTYAKLKRGAAAADRIFALMDQQSLVKETDSPQPMPKVEKSLEFREIDFSYHNSKQEDIPRPIVLNHVSLTVKAGEVVVVVGENGSGKSTLVNLLPRYYDPDHGEVLLDGVNIRNVRLKDLRARMGVVTQETLLFDESIAENIRYGKPEATDEEIEEAARGAHVMSFVEQLPDGLNTIVGEKGNRLSGGQRQRIALARAMLRDPAILILDEATSAIDAQSELLIHEALRHFVKGRTTFLITHTVSQSILDFVSRIVVMEEGRMIANGTHEELIASCETYQRLFNAQVHQSAANVLSEENQDINDSSTQQADETDENSDFHQESENVGIHTKQAHPAHEENNPAPHTPHIIPLNAPRKKTSRNDNNSNSSDALG